MADYDAIIASKTSDLAYWKARHARKPTGHTRRKLQEAKDALAYWQWRKDHNK